MPGGFYRGSFAFIMNEDTFASLPEDIQQVLDKEVFGEPLSREIGKIWDGGDIESLEATEAAADNTITEASEADQAKFKEIASGVIDAVIEEVSATGVDAGAAHEMIMNEMANY
jgi:TRAP-type C4-dicarboxylate transport system substrate-binding protein